MQEYEVYDGDEFGVPVHLFAKNSREQVRVSLSEYHRVQCIDLRVFYQADGKYKPSKKGITLRKDLYLELFSALNQLGELLGFDEDTLIRALDN